jgi:DNA-binding MarR family transcriptional regulator
VAVRLVDRLENEGLVQRRPGADARSRSHVLTKTGQRAAVAALGNRLEVLDGVLAPLTVTEWDELERLLENCSPE